MAKTTSEKTLWQYILLAIGGLGTFVQVLGLLSQSQTLLAQPAVTTAFVLIVLAGTGIACAFVLLRAKPGIISKKTRYYSQRERLLAGGLLATNVIVSILVLSAIIPRPCTNNSATLPSGKFGILIADFTEGLGKNATPKGIETADRTADAVKSRLAVSSIGDRVAVVRGCAIRNSDEALRAGQDVNASLVLWGNTAQFAEQVFEPSFTFVKPPSNSSVINPLLFQVELSRVDSAELPSKISARTTSVAAFIIGLAYLEDGQSTDYFPLAAREFTFAISQTEPELAALTHGSEQEIAIKRTLAIFYTLRGRAFAATGDNQKALEDYSNAEKQDSNYPSIYVGRGNYYYSIDSYDSAEAEYRKALALQELPAAYYGLGNSLFYQQQSQASIQSYLKAIQLMVERGEEPSKVRLVLGIVYKLSGQTTPAAEQFNLVLQSSKASMLQKQQAQVELDSMLTPTATLSPSPLPTASSTSFPISTLMPTFTLEPLPTYTATWTTTAILTLITATETTTPTVTPSLTATREKEKASPFPTQPPGGTPPHAATKFSTPIPTRPP
ncbi:MAG: tetratricopeptide repeat protein [Anaerolineae bacterium]